MCIRDSERALRRQRPKSASYVFQSPWPPRVGKACSHIPTEGRRYARSATLSSDFNGGDTMRSP
eukprot:1595009-Alexandrium_andersonii.AAC.1